MSPKDTFDRVAKLLAEPPDPRLSVTSLNDSRETTEPCGMRLVVVESPYAGDLERNIAYARACLRHCLSIGESPIASHLLLTQEGVLRDDSPSERLRGIDAGHAWMGVCDTVVVYIDLGISKGMQVGIEAAQRLGKRIDRRHLPLTFWPKDVIESVSTRPTGNG